MAVLRQKVPVIDCIIPFFNEGSRVGSVLDAVLNTPEIRSVICVDDGSDDTIHIWPNHQNLRIVRHKTNRGKAAAVRSGLMYVRTPYVFLIDADLVRLTPQKLSACIRYIEAYQPDMFIIRRMDAMYITRFLTIDMIVAGERIVRTDALRTILAAPLHGYELELAINRFFLNQMSHVVCTTLSIQQHRKIQKYGFLSGLWREIKSLAEVYSYRRCTEIWRQIVTFKPRCINLKLVDP